jgi:predicted component of viral defense system (DUF524 family)
LAAPHAGFNASRYRANWFETTDTPYVLNAWGIVTDGRPKKVDVDKMHAYRDAIRDVDDRRVVDYAAILYLGSSSVTFGAGLEAISAIPGNDEPFRAQLATAIEQALIVPVKTESAAA